MQAPIEQKDSNEEVKGLGTVHACQIIHILVLVFQSRKQEQNLPERKEWQSGLHRVWEPKNKETTQKSCIIQNQNSDIIGLVL